MLRFGRLSFTHAHTQGGGQVRLRKSAAVLTEAEAHEVATWGGGQLKFRVCCRGPGPSASRLGLVGFG